MISRVVGICTAPSCGELAEPRDRALRRWRSRRRSPRIAPVGGV